MRLLTGLFMFFLCVLGYTYTAMAIEKLVIAGTGDSQVILRQLAVLFEEKHPGTDIVVPESIGSGGGINVLIKGTAGLARTARELKPKERSHGLTQIPFGISPIVFVANPGMTVVENITMDQVIKIYSGTITNWKELGGDDHKIYPVDREPGDSSWKVLGTELISASGKFGDITSVAKVFYTTPETAEAIVQNRYTIGYLPFSIAMEKQLHIFSIDSVFVGQTNATNDAYPFRAILYLVKPRVPGKLASAFISFVREKEARDLMLSYGVIPVE